MPVQTKDRRRKQENSGLDLAIIYRCGFCRETLRPVPLQGLNWLWALAGIRKHYCPHCFEETTRLWGWLKLVMWPVLFLSRSVNRWLDR